MSAKRIRIIGGSGTGKSTMATSLGSYLGIETVLHLDDYFWMPQWRMKSYEQLELEVREVITDEDNWIIDGNYSKLWSALFPKTTHVIMMRPPLYLSLWRLFWREVIRRSSFKFLPVTRVPINVLSDPNDETLWTGLQILAKSAINHYTTRGRRDYYRIRKKFPNLPIFVFTGRRDRLALLQFLQ